jgi:hypothetical protein
MSYEYKVTPRPPAVGDGWRLQLLEDGEEVGGGVFPLSIGTVDPADGVTWWNGLLEQERAHWLFVAGSAVPADAWLAYLRAEAYEDAQGEAEAWLSTRPGTAACPLSL